MLLLPFYERTFYFHTKSILFLQTLLSLQAQPNKFGVPMITNYPYNETGGSEQNWCITQDHRGVVYVGNYEKGVLEYDGVNWRKHPHSPRMYQCFRW